MRVPFALLAASLVLLIAPARVAATDDAQGVVRFTCPTTVDCDAVRLQRRSITAARLTGPAPVIDGRLDDAAWANAPIATDFVEARPRPASRASLRSEVRVVADDQAIYFAFTFYDDAPERILAPLARRDDETTSDWAFVEIDSRHDRRSAYSLGVNPRGVQVDGVWIDDASYDTAWNGVWQSAGRIDEQGWAAEFRVPFSQLAFSLPRDARELVWGINFYRNNPYRGTSSNWSPRYPSRQGVVSNFNELRVPAPSRVTRLELTPYVAPRVGGGSGFDAGSRDELAGAALRVGGDVKIGLGSNFSLTGTVLPDFGQVEADPSQVNLSAFELFQSERRPFFLEGLELFRFDTSLAFQTRGVSSADESPFYSRRIGRAPRGAAPDGTTLSSLPLETTVLGAAKLSGQTSGGWTLGLFTAVTGDETARARPDGAALATRAVVVEPRASVAVGRAVRTFRRGESTAGLFVANLHRFGLDAGNRRETTLGSVNTLNAMDAAGAVDSARPADAVEAIAARGGDGTNVLDDVASTTTMSAADRGGLAAQFVRDQTLVGVDLLHRFAGRRYEFRGWMMGSRLAGDPEAVARVLTAPQHYFQRPDAPARLRDAFGRDALGGGAGQLRLARIAGSFRWDVTGRAVSPGFDVNELGFQRDADWLLLSGRWQYDRFRPGHWIRAWTVGSDNVGAGWSWSGDPRARVVNGYASIDWRNYWSLRVSVDHAWSTLSMDRLRGGPALRLPARQDLTLTLATDSRRASSVTLDARASREPGSGSWSATMSPLVTVRSADWLQWSIGPSYSAEAIGWQSIGELAAPRASTAAWRADAGSRALLSADEPVSLVGRVTQRALSLTLRSDLLFSPRLALQLYAQPFATVGRYDRFQRIASPRNPDASRRVVPIAVLADDVASAASSTAASATSAGASSAASSTTALAAPPSSGPSVISSSIGSAASSLLRFDLDHDGVPDGALLSPSSHDRALTATMVLRWEYRPGSFLTAAWNHRRDTTLPGTPQSLRDTFGSVFGDAAMNLFLLKVSFRVGR